MRACKLACSLCVLCACSKSPEPAASASASELSKAEPAAPAPEPQSKIPPIPRIPSADAVGYPKAGWSKVVQEDQVPVCAFANFLERERASLIEQALPQKLSAKEPVVFGAYAPHCVNESCDDIPSLQCWVDREGKTLVVHTKYVEYHKDGANCTENCREVTAGCETPPLEAGTYTVRHGSRTMSLKIPGNVKSPCFATDTPEK